MDKNDTLSKPVKMLKEKREVSGEFILRISSILEKYTENFHGLGKMNDYQANLYTNDTAKPIAVPSRPILSHLKDSVDDTIESMSKGGVIEEHLSNELAPWVSCPVIVPKSDSSLRITLDARNLRRYKSSVIRRELLQ